MTIAAVPDYLGKNFSTASPGLRFGMYLQIWSSSFTKEKESVEPLKRAGKLNPNDISAMKSLLERQQAAFKAIAAGPNTLQLDAISTAPFATGLGNEHPTENGFAFLNPYGLPYLPGSGVKGVLRQAVRELASGEWGENDWTDNAQYIAALFGPEPDAEELNRGALTFWDVIPQIAPKNPLQPDDISLAVEIMTPHQKHYYQDGQTPHDSGSPNIITFLTVPHGSGFTFYVQCNLALLQNSAPELAQNGQWQELLQAAFTHAFDWLGFGAKTAVGYGAMVEDEKKKAEREKQQSDQRENERRATLSPEDLAYEENHPVIERFRQDFEQANKGAYQPGREFDSKRNDFVQIATSWEESRSRLEAATLLRETIKWGVSRRGKDRLKNAVAQLEGDAG